MSKQRVLLVAALILGTLGPVPLVGGDRAARELDARRTVEKFLAAALSGHAKEAAALGEPGKAPSREESIKKNFEGLDVPGKKLLVIRLIVDERDALAITENVAVTGTEKLDGPKELPRSPGSRRHIDEALSEQEGTEDLPRPEGFRRHKEEPFSAPAGPMSIRLVKVEGCWLIRDIDLGSEKAEKNIKRFLAQHPGGKEVDLKVKIKLLQKERIATLEKLVDDLTALSMRAFSPMRVSFDEVYEAQLQLLQARLDAAEKESERITLYKKTVDVLKQYETFAEGRVKDGRAARPAVLKVTARRLEAEIELERAKESK